MNEQDIEAKEIRADGTRLAILQDGKEAGHLYLYFLRNDQHESPFALIEDIAVYPEYQKQGIGSKLLSLAIECARSEGCYKIIATSRDDGTREHIHSWYTRAGFDDYGREFRINF